MNRRSLLGRLSTPLSLRKTAERPEHRKVHLEPLEDRKVLATVFVDDTWLEDDGDGTLEFGELVISGAVTANYGSNAFGIVTGSTSPVTGENFLTIADDSVTIDTQYIYSAISVANNGDTVTLLAGTYTESDIVIDKQIVLAGSGRSGGSDTRIVPEVTSTKTAEEFPSGGHMGIIIYAPSVTVRNLHVDGSHNAALGGEMHYHQGITTLYDTQNGADYQSLRAGNLPVVNLGQIGNTNRGEPFITITSVTVDNVWYHGITLSAPKDKNWHESSLEENDDVANNEVSNSIVNNVGNTGNKGVDHIGILIQNLAGWGVGDPSGPPGVKGGNAYDNSITNAGVGLTARTYGVAAFNDNNARNDTAFTYNTVSNAVTAAFRLEDFENNEFFKGRATFSSGNTAIGLWLIHSGGTITNNTLGTTSTNGPFKGIVIEDTHALVSETTLPLLFVNSLRGPGTGVSGSVGIEADNVTGANTDASLLMANSLNVTGFETGLKVLASNAATIPTTLLADNFQAANGAQGLAGNGTAVVLGPSTSGGSVVVNGQFNTPGAVVANSGTLITAQFAVGSTGNAYADALTTQPVPSANTSPPTPTVAVTTSPRPDTIRTGNLTLGSGSTFMPQLNGDGTAAATLILEDFNTFQTWTNTVDFEQINPWGAGFSVPAVLGVWGTGGSVTQDGVTGTVIVNSGSEAGAIFDLDSNPANAIDATPYGYVQVIMRKRPGAFLTQTESGFIGIVDTDATSDLYSFPVAGLTTAYTTFRFNMLTPTIRFVEGDDMMNWSSISGWSISPDFGAIDASIDKSLDIEVESIGFVKTPKASNFEVTGTVTLNDATLSPSVGRLFATSVGQTFTLINNDGADAVSGTFAGLANGATLHIGGGRHFTINYAGGSNTNDVVLTEVANSAPDVDLNGGAGGNDFANTWTDAGPVAVTDAAAATVTDADDTNLVSLTAVITGGSDVDNVLAATATGNISVSYNSGTGTLSMTGSDSLANYQTVLRSITYNNTAGGPGAGSVTISLTASDGANSSVARTSTITISVGGPVSTVVGRHIFYNQSKFDGSSALQNVNDDLAIATNKVAMVPTVTATQAQINNITSYTRGINGIMVDLLPSGGNHTSISASDFTFKTGANNSPSTWTTLTATPTISIRTSAGVSGSDRVTITWANNAIQNTYLEVIVKATANTGLADIGSGIGDVFFFGNLIGETSATTPGGSFTRTLAADGGAILTNGAQASVGITNNLDIDRSNAITLAGDRGPILAAGSGALARINVSSAGPFAPTGDSGGDGGGDAGIASGLTAGGDDSEEAAALPASVAARLDSADSSGGTSGSYAQLLEDAGAADEEEEEDAGVDDDLLDSLTEGL
jgi:hypothetical protein